MSLIDVPYDARQDFLPSLEVGAWMWCADCRGDQIFEQPPCADGHDGDCPEWMCSVCGAAHIDVFLVAERAPST